MKQLSEKLYFEENKEFAVFKILAKIPRWQETMLLVWVVGWTLCGLVVLYESFGVYTKDEKLIMLVYLVFWVYFEFKIIKSFLWKKWGNELIKIDDEGIKYKRDYNGYGSAKIYFKENISKIAPIDLKDKSLAKTYFDTFWTIGHETLEFTYLSKSILIGMGIQDESRDMLLKHLKHQIKKRWEF